MPECQTRYVRPSRVSLPTWFDKYSSCRCILVFVCYWHGNSGLWSRCTLWTRFDFSLSLLSLYLAEGWATGAICSLALTAYPYLTVVLVVRVYHIYSGHSKFQWFILLFSIVGGAVVLGLVINKLSVRF
jgi:hypothetical protein